MTNSIVVGSPQLCARIAGAFYLITIVASIFGFMIIPSAADIANAVGGAAYIGVTVLFYFLFKPVNKGVSLLAAILSLAGLVVGSLPIYKSAAQSFNVTMAFFGFYCLVIGYLVFRSSYLPRILGVLLIVGAVGYLINSFDNLFSLGFLRHPYPHILVVPGFVAETLLCLWLLVKGVDVANWQGKARLMEQPR